MSNAAWSDDRVATLSKLWQGGLSASQIAGQLGGVTRNAVIGKIHRLGLSGRGAPSAPTRAPRVAAPRIRRVRGVASPPSPRPTRVQAIALVVVAPPDGPGLIGDLVHLGAHACKWPIGDPKSPGFRFCGRRADGRYCEAHERLGVRPGTAWRAERDPVVQRALAGLI